MGAPRKFEKYIGIPFKTDGIDFDGCHCWGLYRLMVLMESGINLPTYDSIDAKMLVGVARAILDGQKDAELSTGNFVPVVGRKRALDLVVMRGTPVAINGRHERLPIHCGGMADAKHMIHIERGINSVCVPLTHPSVRHRIIGFYRHRQLHEQDTTA